MFSVVWSFSSNPCIFLAVQYELFIFVTPVPICFSYPPIQHHLRTIDPENALGLSEDSIQCYMVGDQRRQVGNALLPPITPYQAVCSNNEMRILLKGKHKAFKVLVFGP